MVVAVVLAALVWQRGPALSELGMPTAFLVGCFAIVASFPFHRRSTSAHAILGLALRERKVVMVSKSQKGHGPHQLPWSLRRTLTVGALVCLGLLVFDNRAPSQLATAATAWASKGHRCPPPHAQSVVAALPKRRPLPRGCALVRRAFELGYADSLGDCAVTKATDTTAVPTALATSHCNGQAYNEPVLHYEARLLSKRISQARSTLSAFSAAKALAEFRIKLNHFSALAAVPSQAILGSPRIAHHLWTNLPAPPTNDEKRGWRARLMSSRCSVAKASGPPSLRWPGPEPLSQLLSNAIDQLLLSTRYGDPPLHCNEITIHWGAPADICKRLTRLPTQVLADSGALVGVRGVFERHQSRVGRAALERQLNAASDSGDKQPKPSGSEAHRWRGQVSFSCLIIGSGGDRSENESGPLRQKVRSRSLSLWGTEFRTRELIVDRPSTIGQQLDIYQQLAQLLSGVRYRPDLIGHLDPIEPSDVIAPELPLTRLELLAHGDPFTGQLWPLNRADLASVYPLQSLLTPMIRFFRLRYRDRGAFN